MTSTRRRIARRLAAAAAAVGCALPVAGCGLFNRDFTIASLQVMTVNSGTFVQDTMPARFTCADARAVNPPIGWSGMPKGTKSLAVVVDDSSAPITPFVYWIVFNINPESSYIQEGQLPPGARQARNSAGQAAYDPPCPGPDRHQYRFTVYALDTVLHLRAGVSLQQAWMEIAAATIGYGRKAVFATS
jgi:Raf kinase inhibitor-like YbhB/YbcL family protein